MRRLAPVLVAWLAILAACGGGGGKQQATPTGPTAAPGGSAELPLRPDQGAIYIVHADGTGLRKLFDGGDYFSGPLSPDGERLAVASWNALTRSTTLFLLDIASGKRDEVFTADNESIQFGGWSPDGRWLAYMRFPSNQDSALYVYDSQDGSTRRADVALPSIAIWSPAGDAVFVESAYQEGVVYRVAVPSLDVRELIRGHFGYNAFGVSPDGRQIALGSFESDPTVSVRGTAKLILVQADGSGRREVFSVHEEQGFGLGGIDWSPDGGRIAFTRLAFGEDNPSGTYAVDVASGQVLRLTRPASGFDMQIDWASDGGHVLVLRYSCTQCDGAGSKAVLAPADGSGEVPLPGTEEFLSGNSSWSPDGSRFAYGADKLYVAQADGRQAAPIAQFEAKNYAPIGWPDGDRIIFQTGAAAAAAAYAARPDGSGFELVYQGFGAVAPDGETIADLSNDAKLVISAPGRDDVIVPRERLTALGVVGETGAALTWSPDSTRVAIAIGEKGGNGVAVADLQGKLTLAVDAPLDGPVRWSPDGRRLAYASNGALWAVDVLGGEPARLGVVGPATGFDWSPDGTQMATFDGTDVRVLSANGSSTEAKTAFSIPLPLFGTGTLRWSPDGERIAVSSGRQLVVGEVDSGSTTEPVNAIINGFEWANNVTLSYGAQPYQGEFAPGVYLLDVTSSARTALTYSAGRLHKVAGVLADGRIVFVSQFTL